MRLSYFKGSNLWNFTTCLPLLSKGPLVYADYINGMLDDTPMFEEGGRIYDKLNRIYYKDAKALGMSSPNYIMSYLINRS